MSESTPSSTGARPHGAAIKQMMMPRDTNVHGTIFGGAILSHIDLAGSVHARRLGCERVVTIAVDRVEFKLPVFVGDVLSLFCRTLRVGRTSIAIAVEVWAQRFDPPNEDVWVTAAEITFVNVDREGNPIPVPST